MRTAAPASPPRPPAPATRDRLRAVGFAAAAGGLLVGAHLVHPIVRGFRLPIGPDGPLYSWWTRYAETFGLGSIPDRPGVVGAAEVLRGILRIGPVQTIALLGPVLAAACGLAGAALVEALLGPSLRRAWWAALLVGSFASFLAAGWLANLAMACVFLAAACAFGLASRSWRAVWAGAALITAAGLSHRWFLFLGLVILAGVAAAHVPEALRSRARWRNTMAGRMTVGVVVGTAGALGALAVASAGAQTAPGDLSQDAALRRVGLDALVARRYRERAGEAAIRTAVPFAAGGILGWIGLRRGQRRLALDRPGRSPETRHLVALCAWWAVLTVIGTIALVVIGGPANRLLTFAFFVPVAAAVGVGALWTRSGRARILAMILGVAAIAGPMVGWYHRRPFVGPRELTAAHAAGDVVQRLPAGTPVVFLVDTDQAAAGFHVTRFAHIIRMGIPAERIPEVAFAVGAPTLYERGAPTLTGDAEHDQLSRASLEDTTFFRDRGPVLVIRAFNRRGYPGALRSGTVIGPGLVALRTASPVVHRAVRGTSDGRGDEIGAFTWAWGSVAALVLLGLLGWGWARVALPGAGPRAVASLAPSAGLAVAILGAVGADLVGLSPTGPGEAAVGALAVLGYVAARRPR